MLAAYSVKRNQEEGFTLIELLIVVIIIGILAAIALPIFIDQSKVAVDASVKSDVRNTVTNITNAQAQQEGTAKAAVSNDATKIALTAVPKGSAFGTAATTVVATKATSDLTNVPDLGGVYTLDGYNAGGKKYEGTSDNPAWEFSSATGQFSQANDAAVGDGSGGSGGSGGGSNSSANYYGDYNTLAFNSASLLAKYNGTSLNFNSNGGNYQSETYYKGDGATNVAGVPLLSGLDYADGSGTIGGNYDDLQVTNVKFYDSNDSVIDSITNAFADGDCVVHNIIQNAADRGDQDNYPKGGSQVQLSCNSSTASDLTQADADKLAGGKVTFVDSNGQINTLRYAGATSDTYYQHVDAPYDRGYGSGGATPFSSSQNITADSEGDTGTATFATYIDSEGSDDTPYQVLGKQANFTGDGITTINADSTDSGLPSATFTFGPAPTVAEGDEPPASIKETKSYPITITAMHGFQGQVITPASTTGVIQIVANSPWYSGQNLQGASVHYEVRVPDTDSDGNSLYRSTAKVDFTLDSDGSAHSVVFSR